MSQVLEEVDRFFMQTSNLHEAARAICRELAALQIPFAIAGALAANAHGHRRTTEDVDLLMTREGLARFKKLRLGLGWVERFPGSKGLRDTRHLVKIDVILTGEYPGDGKPIAFPDPAEVAEEDPEGLRFVNLRTLLELKLASGMTAPHRLQDLADTMNLIRVNGLQQDYPLHPFVAEKYRELWALARIEDDA
ncbi:MAG: hypothetical protein HY319_18195 [Armatimonadetes bacterium]|nr:hypothetical protein [Armatimonadota bacterium]